MKEIIMKSEYLVYLLKKLYKTQEIEKYDYCVRKVSDEFDNYELINVKTNSLIKLDRLENIQRYLNIRNIESVIYV
jgi:hypothetical protein